MTLSVGVDVSVNDCLIYVFHIEKLTIYPGVIWTLPVRENNQMDRSCVHSVGRKIFSTESHTSSITSWRVALKMFEGKSNASR